MQFRKMTDHDHQVGFIPNFGIPQVALLFYISV